MGGEARQSVAMQGVLWKTVVVDFDQPQQSTDGGAVLLRAVDERLGLTEALGKAMHDGRQAGKVHHSLLDLVRQRIFAIACGYPDCNDARTLANDPVMKAICGRSPENGAALGSQPTLSRLENDVSPRDLLRLSYALAETVLRRQQKVRGKKRVKRVVIDLDGVDDPTYGGQQLALFNGYHDNWCYLPLFPSVQFDDDPAQFVLGAMLRSGKANGDLGAVPMLSRLVPRVRKLFPSALVAVRMDGAFATPEFLDWCEAQGLTYYINLPQNPALNRAAAPYQAQARSLLKAGREAVAYGEIDHEARTWDDERRVIIRANVTLLEDRTPKDNPRFIVTNDRRRSPRATYAMYAKRGDVENRYKELKGGIAFDRASCSAADANQFRYILSVAAFALFQDLRQSVDHPDLVRAQVSTLRERIIKLSVQVVETARRIVFKAPAAFGWIAPWRHAALACAAPRL